jgi:Domain of unknown function (DUF4261)
VGFLDRLWRRGAKQEPEPTSRTNLAMLALRTGIPVGFQRIHQHLVTTWAEISPSVDLDDGEEAAVIRSPTWSVVLGYMGMPIPWSDLEWPTKMSWQWPGARDALQTHAAHLIIAASSDVLTPVELSLLLTRVTAAAAAMTDAAGVYYGNAALVIAPEQYVELAADANSEDLPIMLWVGFHPVRESAGLSAYTTGMSVFGHLELEVHESALPPDELLGRLADAAHYQLATGARLEDGQTLGATAEERIDIRHRRSRFIDDTITCQLAL